MKNRHKRKLWFRGVKNCMKLAIKKSNFVYLGDKIEPGSIILSNHEGTSAPLALELYSGLPIRFWGAYEMNSGLVKMYKYQTKLYYHQKKHWNLGLARAFCLLASPLTNMFYKGLDLISTYPDARLRTTITKSTQAIKDGQNIVIFPEDSTKGYLKELEGFHPGCILLLQQCIKQGLDPLVYVSYFKKQSHTYVFGKPVRASQLLALGNREQVAKILCDQCNQLASVAC